jgi:amino acid transporter
MTKKNKRSIRVSLFILVPFLIFLGLDKYLDINFGEFAEPKFLFNYTGILLGFAITLYTFIVSQFSDLKDKIIEKSNSDEDKTRKLASLKSMYSEVKDNVWFIFICLLIAILFYLVPEYLYDKCPDLKVYTRSTLATLFSLSILSIKDLIGTSFKVAGYIGVDE